MYMLSSFKNLIAISFYILMSNNLLFFTIVVLDGNLAELLRFVRFLKYFID